MEIKYNLEIHFHTFVSIQSIKILAENWVAQCTNDVDAAECISDAFKTFALNDLYKKYFRLTIIILNKVISV